MIVQKIKKELLPCKVKQAKAPRVHKTRGPRTQVGARTAEHTNTVLDIK